MKYLSIGLLAIFAIGCCGQPEGEVLTVEGYVAHRESGHCYDEDFWEIRVSIVQEPERSTGKWWEAASSGWRSEDGLTKYTELKYYIRKDVEPKVQEGHYYVIRYRQRDPFNRHIISARKPLRMNRKIHARIQGAIYEYKNAEKIPVPREIEKIPKPRVKSTAVGSYFWPTYDAPEQLGTTPNFVPMFRVNAVHAVQVMPRRTNVIVTNRFRGRTVLFR